MTSLKYKIPEDIREELELYVKERIKPGGFLTRILENDLKAAGLLATGNNRLYMYEIVLYVNFDLPYLCRGNAKRVKDWLEKPRVETVT